MPGVGFSNHFVVKQLDSLETYEMNQLNESFSMNVFRVRGMAYIPLQTEVHAWGESDA
jgi:hypothetical protein